jgi:hypothetical protein
MNDKVLRKFRHIFRHYQKYFNLCMVVFCVCGITNSSAVSAPLPGQIIVDPNNPAWLKYNDGGPFFMAGPGDPEEFLYRGTLNPDGTRNGDQMSLINKLKGTGANCIYFQAIRSHGGDGDSTHNPFVNNNPADGINMKVLDQWETWFTEMDNNGIVIYFFFCDDSARIWKRRFWDFRDVVNDSERNFVKNIVNRFEHHKNLIWVVAEEYQEAFSARHISQLAAVIHAADDHEHPIAVHKLSGIDFSEFADDPNIDQFAIQYNKSTATELHNGMVTAWNGANGKYNLNLAEAIHYGTGPAARKKHWAIAMAGTYVMVLGWDIANTPINDLEDCGRLIRFMESTNFNEMAPHDELKYGGTEYVLALPSNNYIAYASNLEGNIGLKNMNPGTFNIKWFDVTNGKAIIQDSVSVIAGNQTWGKPKGIGNEVAVFMRRIK